MSSDDLMNIFFVLLVLGNIVLLLAACFFYIVAWKNIFGFHAQSDLDTDFMQIFILNNNDGLTQLQIFMKNRAIKWIFASIGFLVFTHIITRLYFD